MNANVTCPKASARLSWLADLLGQQKDTLSRLLQSLKAFGVRGSMKPSHFKQFILLLNQVADEKEKETALISRIEAIEARHRFARTHNDLRKADEPKPQQARQQPLPECRSERTGTDLLWLYALYRLFKGRPLIHK